MKKFLPLLCYMLLWQFMFSQNAQQALERVWKEKTEWRQNARVTYTSAHTNIDRSNGEVEVSGTTDAESEVHAAVNPTDSNNIVVSSNFVGGGFFPDRTNYIYYTNDFGATWNTSAFKTAPTASGAFIAGGGDPYFAYNDTGNLYFSWINLWFDGSFNSHFDLFWATSADGGNNWIRNAQNDKIGSAVGTGLTGGGFDKEWMASDNIPSSPYYHNLYCSFFQIDGNSNATIIGVRKKAAGAASFDTVTTQVSSGTYKFLQFASIATDGNGAVHVSFFASVDSITYSLYHAVSTNGATTFQPENKISDVNLGRFTAGVTDTILGVSSSRLYPCAYIACDNTGSAFNNNLYMVWTANGISSNAGRGYDVYFSRSTNGGSSWSAPQILNDNTNNINTDQYYPALTVSPKGRLIVQWVDRRNDPQNKLSDIYLTYSDNGGQSFQPDIKVTMQPTDFSTIGSQNGGFGIGEYNAVVATNTYAIPVWADGRTGDGNLNLYAAFINLDGTSTGVESITSVNGAFRIATVFPNPTHSVVHLEYHSSENGTAQIELLDVHGRLIKNLAPAIVTAGNGIFNVGLGNLPAATYLIKVALNSTVCIRRVVKGE